MTRKGRPIQSATPTSTANKTSATIRLSPADVAVMDLQAAIGDHNGRRDAHQQGRSDDER